MNKHANKIHTTFKNAFNNLHVDCESSDQFSRYNNLADDDSMFVFGAEDQALENIHVDCESSDQFSRYDTELEPFSITGQAKPDGHKTGYKRYVSMLYTEKKVHA